MVNERVSQSRVPVMVDGFKFDVSYRSLNLKESTTKHNQGKGQGEVPVHAIGL